MCSQTPSIIATALNPNPNQQITLPNMVTLLKQIRNTKKLNDHQNGFYDKLIENYSLQDKLHINLLSVIVPLRKITKSTLERLKLQPSDMNYSENNKFFDEYTEKYKYVIQFMNEYSHIVSEIRRICMEPVASTIFDCEEAESIYEQSISNHKCIEYAISEFSAWLTQIYEICISFK